MTVSVVTGSSTGIGYATALRLARDGHAVIATMRDPTSCDLADVATQDGLDIDVRPLDVNDDESVVVVFKDVLGEHGAVDVLVNNAGIGPDGVIEETDIETFRSVMETNFFGALRCTKAVLPTMRERGSGAIVNVSSTAANVAAPSMAAYAASKWALEAASESLAAEVAPFGIRVVLIQPGVIITPIWSKVDMTPPTGPYAKVRQRLGRSVVGDMANGSSADVVADCIAEAISTDSPKLRWRTGYAAERNARNRAAISDEEYIALWTGPSDDFKAWYLNEAT